MKKVLIITYYWPPSGGSGVQRWLNFTKYLPENGWQPIVYTVENGEYPVLDESLNAQVYKSIEVIKQPIWEPYSLYKKFLGKKKEEKFGHAFIGEKPKGFFRKFIYDFTIWLRGNFFIPDARMFWIRPSISYLNDYLKNNKVDLIVSNGPPHSVHLIARKVAKNNNIKWLADFRDPWTGIYYFEDLKLSFIAKFIHKYLERRVLIESNGVVCVGKNMKINLTNLASEQNISDKIKVITNGFDAPTFQKIEQLDEKFTITHVGLFSPKQNHQGLWNGIKSALEINPEIRQYLKINLIGSIDLEIVKELENREIPFEVFSYKPHSEILAIEKKSQVLLLSLSVGKHAKELISGKLFEYILANRPILCIGPTDGDAADIITETQSGVTFDFDDKEGIRNYILSSFDKYKTNQLINNQVNIQKYSRKNLTKELAEFMDKL